MKDNNKETKFKSGELKKIVLATLGIGAILGGSILITPNFPIVIGTFIKLIEEFREIKISKNKIKRVLKKLEEREIVFLEKKGREVYVTLKENNNIEVVKYSIKEVLNLKKKKDWQRKWFLVIFDVPEKQRNKRDYLRSFLAEIGFYPYQKSVYVFPYECEKEITLIKKIVEGGEYIDYIVAERLERENELRKIFNIS